MRLPRVPRFPIEAGHIQLFARAVGDANPVYSDGDYAAKCAVGGIIAPPTFTEASNHFDEDWPYRPRWGQPWFGSAATPSGVDHRDNNGGTDMHAETHFVYYRPVRPGMILSVSARLGREWKKWGSRSGELRFHEIVSEFRDERGEPVVDCTTVVLHTEKTVTGTTPAERDSMTGAGVQDPHGDFARGSARGSPLKIGDKIQDVLVRNLSRAQIVQYAGVSGDYSPQHIDEVYNTRVAGYPSVFAHGMLTMGMAGRVVTDFIGDGRLRKFGFQFRQQVWPGDSLFADVEVTGMAAEAVPLTDLAISVTNQRGQMVGRGYASALLDD